MDCKIVEDMSYKELVRHLIIQIDQMNVSFQRLDERGIHLQKMVAGMQTTLDHKANKGEIIELAKCLGVIEDGNKNR